MCGERMDYEYEVNSFYDWLETNPLGTSGIVLWNALMHIANKAGYPDKFTVAMSVLEVKTGLKKDAIERARNNLEQSCRIRWEKRKGNQSALYTLIPFVTFKTSQTTPQVTAQTTAQVTAISKTIDYINNNSNSAQEEPNVFVQVERELKRPITPMEAQIISAWMDSFSIDLVKEACKRAVFNEVFSLRYIDRILLNWEKANVVTLADVEAYELLHFEKGGKQRGSTLKLAEPFHAASTARPAKTSRARNSGGGTTPMS